MRADRTRWRWVSGATGALLLMSSLAACGGGGDDDSAGATDEINVLFPQTHAGASEYLAEEFENQTGIKVNVTLVPYDEVQQKATLDVQSGAATFDVIDTWYVTIGALADDGVIAPIDDLADSDGVDSADFIPAIYDPYSEYDGQRWALPFDGDAEVLFYNKAILEQYGIQPPTTWDEYEAAVQTITEGGSADGIYGAALMGQKAPIIIASTYANRLAGYGGEFLDADGNPALDSDAAVAAAQDMLDVSEYALPTPSETAFDQALAAFLGGKVGFMEFWTDLGVFAQDPEQSQIVDNWGVVRLPVGGDNTESRAALDAGFGMALSAQAPHEDAARQFIEFATSAETNLALITTTGSGIDANRLSTLQSPEYTSFAPEVAEVATASLDGALAWPTGPESPELMQTLSDNLAAMLIGDMTPEEAISQTQDSWEQTLG